MRVLIAPNAFKGSLSGPAAARAFARGVRRAFPGARTELLPIADGGDGLIDALRAALGGRLVSAPARGPLGERRRASYLWIPERRTAVVEMARASGLALVPPARRRPLAATSRGTGDLMRDAVRRGARTILVGMGGSASNDGGAGAAKALGARLLDENGRELADGAGALAQLASIDARALRRLLSGVRVIALSDVTNPLLGPEGSARVFGPQKGATPVMVRAIDEGLSRWSRVIKKDLGRSVGAVPGGGAAGGLGAGLLAFTRAVLVPGADWVLDRVGADAALRRADVALTGEGRLDRTSLLGKAPVALARRARRAGVPCVAACGQAERKTKFPFRRVVSFSDAGARSAGDAVRRAGFWGAKAAALAVKAAALTAVLAVGVFAQAPDPYKDADLLYFHRDQPGNLERAEAELEAMTAHDGDDPQVWWRLARVLVRVGERQTEKTKKLDYYASAQEDAEKSLTYDEKNAEAHFWRGVAMGRYGQTKGILKSLFMIGPMRAEMRQVLLIDPKHGGAHHVLGEMLWQIPGFAGGDKKAALAEFEKAAALSPDYSANYPSLVKAYLKFGDKEKARAALARLEAIKTPADPANYADDLAETQALFAK